MFYISNLSVQILPDLFLHMSFVNTDKVHGLPVHHRLPGAPATARYQGNRRDIPKTFFPDAAYICVLLSTYLLLFFQTALSH